MVKAKIREKYQGLSRQELLHKAYELGFNYERNSQSCSQCPVAAIHELLDFDDVIVRVASSLAGGSAVQFLGTCGALSGGVIALDYFFGRPVENMSYQECIQANIEASSLGFEVAQLLADRFVKEHGTIICAQIQRQLFGRFYYATDPDEARKMGEAGAHSDPDKCCRIVGNAVRWVMEILLDKGVIEL
jgi:C_GCAxxG_C_C family probable redox protein